MYLVCTHIYTNVLDFCCCRRYHWSPIFRYALTPFPPPPSKFIDKRSHGRIKITTIWTPHPAEILCRAKHVAYTHYIICIHICLCCARAGACVCECVWYYSYFPRKIIFIFKLMYISKNFVYILRFSFFNWKSRYSETNSWLWKIRFVRSRVQVIL